MNKGSKLSQAAAAERLSDKLEGGGVDSLARSRHGE